MRRDFDPDEPRDEEGKWTDGGGDGGGGAGPSAGTPEASASKKETDAILFYQGYDGNEINDDLRKGDGGEHAEKIQALDSLMAKTGLKQATTVYRGVKDDVARQIQAAWAKSGRKATFTDKGFTSTSREEKDVGKYFGHNVIRINLKAGQHAIDVEQFHTLNAGEHEMLLPSGTKFKLTSYEPRPEGAFISMDAVKS